MTPPRIPRIPRVAGVLAGIRRRPTADLWGILVSAMTVLEAIRILLPDWDRHGAVGQAFAWTGIAPEQFAVAWGGVAAVDLGLALLDGIWLPRAICLGLMGSGWLLLCWMAVSWSPPFLFWPLVLGTVVQNFLVLYLLAGRWARARHRRNPVLPHEQ